MWFLTSVPTSPPLSPTGVAVSSTILLLSWSPPNPEDRNGIIRHYLLNITEVETGRTFQYTPTTAFLQVPLLHPFYTYQWSVSAYTVGEGPYTNTSTVTTPEDSQYHITVCHKYILLSFPAMLPRFQPKPTLSPSLICFLYCKQPKK